MESSSWGGFFQTKNHFYHSPILNHPDPSKPFFVEVDVPKSRVGYVLSQCFGEKPKTSSFSMHSKKLSPALQNYDIGICELLAVKLAPKQWHHRLEGAVHTFTIFTGHKNLKYLKTAKHLNPHQVCWLLFFTWFNFTLMYRPGSKNTKADSLSRIHPRESDPTKVMSLSSLPQVLSVL